MDDLQDYLKSLNPTKDEQTILIYGSKYKLWREGKYLGEAIWTKDENIGDSFQVAVVDQQGATVQEVFLPDTWELIIE